MTSTETIVPSPSGVVTDRSEPGKPVALEMRGISKTFGPVKALNNVSLMASRSRSAARRPAGAAALR
jgi:hypothetical protein